MKIASDQGEHLDFSKVKKLSKVPADLLSVFNELSVVDDGRRLKNISTVLKILKRYKNLENVPILEARFSADKLSLPESHAILDYTVKRLAAGIGSYVGFSHQGFSVAFTLVLQNYAKVIPVDYLFNVIRHKLHTEESGIGKRGENHIKLGQVMAYAALVKSGYVSKMTAAQLAILMNWLLKVPHTQPLLFPIAVETISSILQNVGDDETYKMAVREAMKSYIQGGWNKLTPDKLSIALVLVQHKIMNKQDCRKYWGAAKLTDLRNTDHLIEMLKQTTNYHPIFHPLNKALVEAFSPQELLIFWKSIVESPRLSPSLQFLIYKLTPLVLNRCKRGQEGSVLLPTLIDQLARHLTDPTTPLSKAALNLIQLLHETSKTTKYPQLQVSIFKALVSHPNCGYKLDSISQTRCISGLVNNMLPKALMIVGEEAMAALVGEESIITLPKRESGLNHMHVWCSAILSHTVIIPRNAFQQPSESGEQSNAEYFLWQRKALQFCLMHSLFEVKEPSDELAHCAPLKNPPSIDVDHIPLHQELETSLVKMLDRLVPIGRNRPRELVDTLQSFMTLYTKAHAYSLKNPSTLICRNPLHDEEMAALTKTMKVIKKINKTSSDETEERTDDQAFQILLLQLLLNLLTHPDDRKETLETVEEVKQCYTKLKSGVPPSDDEPYWMDVLVDILISLMARSVHLLRSTARNVLYQLIHHVKVSTLQQIIHVFSSDTAELVAETGNEEEAMEDEGEEGNDSDTDDEESSSDDSGDEDDSSGEDEQTSVTDDFEPEFKLKLAKVLQLDKANDEADDDLSDSQMLQIDEKISDVFHTMMLNKTNSKQAVSQRAEVRNFQTRCMDLLEEIALKSYNASLEAELLMPLLLIIGEKSRYKEMAPMATRAEKILTKLTSRSIKLTGDPLDLKTIDQIAEDILQLAPTRRHYPLAKQLAASLVHLMRVERTIEKPEDTSSVVEKHVEAAIVKATEPKKLKWNLNLFKILFKRLRDKFWGSRVHLLNTIQNSEMRHSSRINACILMEELLSKSQKEASEDSWRSYLESLDETCIAIVEECKDLKSKDKEVLLKHFFRVLVRTSVYEPGKNWRTSLEPLKSKRSQLKRDSKKFWRKLSAEPTSPGKRKHPDSKQNDTKPGKIKRENNV